MGRQLANALGSVIAGTGVLPLWNTFNENVTEPRIRRVIGATGSISDSVGLGYYGQSGVDVFTGGDGTTYIEFEPGVFTDQIRVITLSGGYRTKFELTDNVNAHYYELASVPGEVWTPDAGVTALQPDAGYVRANNVATDGGLLVVTIDLPARQSNWILRVRSATGGVAHIAALEARDNATGGIRISNLAQGGVTLNSLVANSNESNGFIGLPLAVDATKADLYIVSIGINDFQAHSSVATYKTQLETLVDRIRATGPTGTASFGVGVNADCLLMITPQPNYAMIPADHVETPPLSDFWTALYQVADEKGLAVVDNAFRWVDYASSSDLFRDNIHPSTVGAADIGNHVGHLLAAV
jgi:lysophospholipase L1-like esterase